MNVLVWFANYPGQARCFFVRLTPGLAISTRNIIKYYIYGSFHGRFTVNIFFRRNIYFCLLTSKIIDTFFFQCDT